jgi:hypothetical protein
MSEIDIWKDVVGFECSYEVSNTGKVKRKETGKILKLTLNNSGYYQITLHKNREKMTIRAHQLVAKAFLPNPNNLPCVNHKDEIKTNNDVENLEWCTFQYNINYGTALKRATQNRNYEEITEKAAMSRSKHINQYDINGNFIATWKNAYVAEQHGYRRDSIIDCCKGKHEFHQGYKWEYEKSEEKQQREQGWIPVSERLPEKEGFYIFQTIGGKIHEWYYKNESLFVDVLETDKALFEMDKILAWMPLPEPYKEAKP